MKKMLKRNSGFTLIELIVVIAILAILAGVGTVAYSGYINKAHKANDIQLAGDVRYALEIAAVAPGTDLESGAVVITKDGVSYVDANGTEKTDSKLQAAVEKAFGDTSSLKLQYDKWHEEGGAANFAYDIGNSSYNGNVSGLLGNVQNLTTSLKTVAESDKGNITNGQFGEYLGNNGIDTSNQQAVANAATMFVADRVKNTDSEAIDEVWAGTITSNGIQLNTGNSNGTGSTLANMAVSYASAQAAIEYIKKDTSVSNQERAELDKVLTDMFSGKNTEEVMQSINANQTKLNNMLTNSSSPIGKAYNNYRNLNEGEQIYNDSSAFMQSMNAVNELKGQLSAEDLESDNLYSGKVNSMVTAYMKSGTILKNFNGESAIAIICAENSGNYTITSYPFFG